VRDHRAGAMASQRVKHEGGQVRKGDVLAVIETDKAAREMEAYDEGVRTGIVVAEGTSVPVGTPIAVIGGKGAAEAAAPSPAPAHDHPERVVVSPLAPAPLPGTPPAIRAAASPLARKFAREHGVGLAVVSGSGPGDRIVHRRRLPHLPQGTDRGAAGHRALRPTEYFNERICLN
jgi:pyruvate dehydrogenase E2 component (dihydrolipoamide acetyltransferase)